MKRVETVPRLGQSQSPLKWHFYILAMWSTNPNTSYRNVAALGAFKLTMIKVMKKDFTINLLEGHFSVLQS